MTKTQFKNMFIPDTPEEFRAIAKGVKHLGNTMTAVLIFAADPIWVITSHGLTWLGEFMVNYIAASYGIKEEESETDV